MIHTRQLTETGYQHVRLALQDRILKYLKSSREKEAREAYAVYLDFGGYNCFFTREELAILQAAEG